jgi:hypothetical protein
MIEEISLKNFQGHEDKTIKLAPVTVLIGPNDVGKTSFVRALKYISTGRPIRNKYPRHGAESFEIRAKFDEGHVVKRIKGKGKNIYIIDGKKLKAVNKGVPEEVSTALNLTTGNFQNQFSMPFWLSDTPGQVSRNLNAIVNLSAIDDALTNVAQYLKSARREELSIKERLDTAQAQLEALSWVSSLDAKLAQVEYTFVQHTHKRTRLAEGLALARKATKLRLRQESSAKAALGVAKAIRTTEQLAQSIASVEVLGNLITQARQCYTIVQQPKISLTNIEEIINSLTTGETQCQSLRSLIRTAEAAQQRARKSLVRLENTKRAFAKIAKGKICPICQKKM